MEKLKNKLAVTNKALRTLHEVLEYAEEHRESAPQDLQKIIRDSTIQRFEYCVDLFWKLLRVYLEEFEKITIEIASPRGIIREAARVQFMTEEQAAGCMQIIVNRNKTSHIYHEDVAQEISADVPKAYVLMSSITAKIVSA